MAGDGDTVLPKGAPRTVDVRRLRALPPGVVADPGVQRLAAELAPGFYLDVGNVCNQRCLYCAVPRDALYRTSREQAATVSRLAVQHGFATGILIGGEPTVWPHLDQALADMAGAGVQSVILTTNGLELADRNVLDRLAAAGVRFVHLSLDDFDPGRQARLSAREDNPVLLAAAIDNLAATGTRTCFYTVGTRLLLGRGGEFAAAAAATAAKFPVPPAFMFAGLKPLQTARGNMDSLAISLGQTAGEIRTIVQALAPHTTVSFRDIPLCLVPDMLPLSMDLYHENAAIDASTGRPVPAALAEDRTFVPACAGCPLKPWCPGIYADYLKRYGDKEFGWVG